MSNYDRKLWNRLCAQLEVGAKYDINGLPNPFRLRASADNLPQSQFREGRGSIYDQLRRAADVPDEPINLDHMILSFYGTITRVMSSQPADPVNFNSDNYWDRDRRRYTYDFYRGIIPIEIEPPTQPMVA